MARAGITLEPGNIVTLELDGTLVYVENVQPTFAAVVALPEQLSERADERVFTPGKVGAKKISPFSSAEKHFKPADLSPRNRDFIRTYERLREQHGPHYVQRTPEEEAAMSVRKETGSRAPRGAGKRAQKRAAMKIVQLKCVTCGEQRGHPKHPDDHEFVAPAGAAASVGTTDAVHTRKRKGGGSSPRAAAPATRYTLASEDLSKARAQPRGDKFNEGNRSHRVVLALKGLPNSTGTLDEVIAAVCSDGKTPPANPEKVVRRALHQLRKPEFGSCVTCDSAPADEASGTDDE